MATWQSETTIKSTCYWKHFNICPRIILKRYFFSPIFFFSYQSVRQAKSWEWRQWCPKGNNFERTCNTFTQKSLEESVLQFTASTRMCKITALRWGISSLLNFINFGWKPASGKDHSVQIEPYTTLSEIYTCKSGDFSRIRICMNYLLFEIFLLPVF